MADEKETTGRPTGQSHPRAHLEALLDAALAATFPASDPVAITLHEAVVDRADRRRPVKRGQPGPEEHKES